MSLQLHSLPTSHAQVTRALASSTKIPYGRSAYRHSHSFSHDVRLFCRSRDTLSRSSIDSLPRLSAIRHLPPRFSQFTIVATRPFSFINLKSRQSERRDDINDPPRHESSKENSTEGKPSNSSSGSESEEPSGSAKEDSAKDKDQEQKKKDDPPPPPPHGDKSPWQVFTDTLRSEFQASKEWNESTKALASSAHQFTENESVKKARAAYSAASGAATSTTSSALRNTGKVLGHGAAWTWDTPVVKGVRAGVNATSKGIDKATKPVRETTAYKTTVSGVKNVIDDGSSSRYGGWIEKEERRKQRELRELNEARSTGRSGKRVEKAEEDPE